MTAKEFLSEYQNCERRIIAKIEKISEYKEMAKSISIRFKEKVQTTKQANGTEKIICMYMDMQLNLYKDVADLKSRLEKITKTINKIQDNTQKEVLERKYINLDSFSKIAEKMFISERQIFRIHGKALENIQKIIDK